MMTQPASSRNLRLGNPVVVVVELVVLLLHFTGVVPWSIPLISRSGIAFVRQQSPCLESSKLLVPSSISWRRSVTVAMAHSDQLNQDVNNVTQIDASTKNLSSLLYIHHTAVKTRNITTAVQFYSLLGYTVACRFRAGPARAAWLELPTTPGSSGMINQPCAARLELIEVPAYLLQEAPGMRARALDLMAQQQILGYNHVALDVTRQMRSQNVTLLSTWMEQLNQRSVEMFQRKLRIALQPRQQIIGRQVYELAFLYDADGCLVELLYLQGELPQNLESGWEPWNGEVFLGETRL